MGARSDFQRLCENAAAGVGEIRFLLKVNDVQGEIGQCLAESVLDRKPARCRHPSEKQHVNVRSRPCKQGIGSASKQEHSNTIRQDSLLDDLLEGLQDLLVNSALPLVQPGADLFSSSSGSRLLIIHLARTDQFLRIQAFHSCVNFILTLYYRQDLRKD